MAASPKPVTSDDLSRAPRIGLRLMVVIVVTMALLAIYANVQKVRRNKIEGVTVTPASAVQSSPAPR